MQITPPPTSRSTLGQLPKSPFMDNFRVADHSKNEQLAEFGHFYKQTEGKRITSCLPTNRERSLADIRAFLRTKFGGMTFGLPVIRPHSK